MKKKRLNVIIVCLMLFFTLFLSACGGSSTTTDPDDNGGSSNSQLDDIINNVENGVDYNKFTYTYYDENGRELIASAFNEAYIFVDPGSEGTYYDEKTDSSVTFAQLVDRQVTSLSEDIAYRLTMMYGTETASEFIFEEEITYNLDTPMESDYYIKYNASDILGKAETIRENSKFNSTNIVSIENSKYYLDDIYVLTVLSNVNAIPDDLILNRQCVTRFNNFIKPYFNFVDVINGYGFDVEINSELILSKSGLQDNTKKWNVADNLNSNYALKDFLKDKIIDLLSGGSGINSIDHIGFTESEKEDIKNLIINEIIGATNYNNDALYLEKIKANTGNIGAYVTLEKIATPRVLGGSTFESEYSNLMTLRNNSIDPENDSQYIAAYEAFINSDYVKNYLDMFKYKGYEIAVDAIMENVFDSTEYKDDQPVNMEGEEQIPLYKLFPRVAVYIVPGQYLGGEYDESLEDDINVEEEEYDFDEIADKSEFDPNSPPITTMEPYLPPWKILSIVYKPDNVYGINNVTNERINGTIVPSLDVIFVGEKGYTSLIESTVTYVANGSQVVAPKDVFITDELYDDVCPDMSADGFAEKHYLEIFDLTKTEGENLNKYVMGAYNGFDLIKMAEQNSKINIKTVGTQDSTLYYKEVTNLPISHNFISVVEDEFGDTYVDIIGLGGNYLKLDVIFTKIQDDNGNNVTNSVKRTNLGVISIEPQLPIGNATVNDSQDE